MASNLDKHIAEANAAGLSYGKYMTTLQQEEPKPEPKAEPQVPEEEKPLCRKVCAHCGKEFPVFDRRSHKYCSDHCAKAANRERTRKKEKVREEKTAKPVEKAGSIVIDTTLHESVPADSKYRRAALGLLAVLFDLLDD